MPSHALAPVLAFSAHSALDLHVYRWVNPQTDCPYPFLAATRDCSTSLLIGNFEACFELVSSGETRRWLPDFAATGIRMSVDLVGLCALAENVCAGCVDCGILLFNNELRVSGLRLVLVDEDGEVEYVAHSFGHYERCERNARYRVSAAETALLHMCCTMGASLARQVPNLLRELPPPTEQAWTDEERASRAAVRSR